MECGHGVYCRIERTENKCYCCPPPISDFDYFKMQNEPLVDELVDLRAEKDALERREKAIRRKLMERMQEHYIESFETDSATVSYVEDADYKSIDSEKLRSKYPSAYRACCTYKCKDGYLVLRIKKGMK